MTRVSVKGFKIFDDRHGKPRCYHRATRTPIDLVAAPLGSAEFFAECARITTLTKVIGIPRPGTLGMLIAAYRKHDAFTDLAPRTRRDYQRVFDYLQPVDGTALVKFNRPLVVRIRDKAANHGWRFANYVKAVLSIIFGWGVERGYLQFNPAEKLKNIRRPKNTPEANRPWSDEERHVSLEEVPAHIKPAIALMMFTGLGPKGLIEVAP